MEEIIVHCFSSAVFACFCISVWFCLVVIAAFFFDRWEHKRMAEAEQTRAKEVWALPLAFSFNNHHRR